MHDYFRRPHVDYRRSYYNVLMMFDMVGPILVVKTFAVSAVGNKTAAGSEEGDSAG